MLFKAMLNDPRGVAREMDRLFDSMGASQPFGFVPMIRSPQAFPAVNLWEDAETIFAEAELPGLSMDDIEVLVTDDQLTLRGDRTVEAPESARALRRERAVGAFERTIELPAPIDPGQVEAKVTNGVLSITMPKAAVAKPRRVEVKALPSQDA